MRRLVLAAVFGVLVAVAGGTGCGGGAGGGDVAPADQAQLALTELGNLLRAPNRPPAKLADLAAFEQTFSLGFNAVKTGEVVVLWGTPMLGEGDAGKGGGTVVAYEKSAPTAGGWALYTSGDVKKVAAADIPAPKGGKK